MKYLSDYMDQPISDALKEAGAFFAFSSQQFEEAKKADVKYVSLGGGLIAPVEIASKLVDTLNQVTKDCMQLDLKENGKKGIIHRELGNYETHLSGDISDAVSALEGYGVTEEDVKAEYAEYYQMCVDNDYF